MSAAEEAAPGDVLQVLAGEWEVELTFPSDPPGVVQAGRTTFEWLFGRYLVQRMDGPPGGPHMQAIIAYNPDKQAFEQHYYDSRGVVRIYEMTLGGGVWTLLRTRPDFAPLEFAQRFTGRLADDGNAIEARWESSPDGATWKDDFDITYRRVR
jgi:Protein of unknown function (DUF1579)